MEIQCTCCDRIFAVTSYSGPLTVFTCADCGGEGEDVTCGGCGDIIATVCSGAPLPYIYCTSCGEDDGE